MSALRSSGYDRKQLEGGGASPVREPTDKKCVLLKPLTAPSDQAVLTFCFVLYDPSEEADNVSPVPDVNTPKGQGCLTGFHKKNATTSAR
jgi:hypothetical protein